ncbi:hypothetical protein BZB76_4040 [Actinomadura pelletieri DSM 43383]|uniref:Secreted protein n=1 Tax=Actinomadura pelletieri DSM 43383 TaxID=1120940 RepID=A0A495QL96_9ACTN|nr:hypothetical protein [Actinomadura pelletieri]RKS73350.1 hypothetical protein BZB76_4040 [Actinomadura pelletieri DSM 43383]
MGLRGFRHLAAVTGAAVLVTALGGTGVASARTSEIVCGPEVDLGPVVYQTCSEVVGSWSTGYGTQPFIYAQNRGIVGTDVSITIQRWNYSTSTWETTATGSKTLGAGGNSHFFSTNLEWACGDDARERGRVSSEGDTGDWSEVLIPAEC